MSDKKEDKQSMELVMSTDAKYEGLVQLLIALDVGPDDVEDMQKEDLPENMAMFTLKIKVSKAKLAELKMSLEKHLQKVSLQ